MQLRLRIVVAVVALVFAPAVVGAQSTGTIAGTIRDTSGAVVPGVTVEAASPALIEKVRAVTGDSNGEYKIVGLPPGVYSVTFTLSGFSTVKREGIALNAAFTATVNADLTVGEVAETITVSAQSPVVDVQNVQQQTVMTREVIDSIPTGKNYASLGVLIPGVTTTGSTFAGVDVGGVAGNDYQALIIHGSRSGDQSLELDSVPVLIYESNGASTFFTPPDLTLEETTMQTGAIPADVETGGVRVNYIPKSGGNSFQGGVFANFANHSMQANNLDADLISKGITSSTGINYLYEINPVFGGPLARDKVWFYLGFRNTKTLRFSTMYPDSNLTDWVYTPDRTQEPSSDIRTNNIGTGRITWQASSRNKINGMVSIDRYCACSEFIGGGNPIASYYATHHELWPTNLAQVTWTSTLTNKLLLEAGGAVNNGGFNYSSVDGAVGPAAIEQSTNIGFRAWRLTGVSLPGGVGDIKYPGTLTLRGTASYVTGSHALKIGGSYLYGTVKADYFPEPGNFDYNVVLLQGKPVQAQFVSVPYSTDDRMSKGSIFAQDQWTLKQLTMNLGLRFDYHHEWYPAIHLAPTRLIPTARDFPGNDNVVNWKDLSPRIGVSYDLFGNGKTAIKASASRYVAKTFLQITRFSADPAFAAGGLLARSWTDNNGDFVPQGDVLNPAANDELGPSTNANWGKGVVSTQLDPSWAQGWGKRGYNWEFSGGIQHELMPRVSLNASYFRRIYGNFFVNGNQARTSADFDQYCVTAPNDSRLPNPGEQICGLYDVTPAKVAAVNNVTTLASNYGNQYEHWDGVDLTINARLTGKLLLAGGTSTGKTMTDNCDLVSNHLELLPAGTPLSYCRQETPFQTQFKAMGSYMFPWDLEVAATVQNAPCCGAVAASGVQANYVATNAVIAPSLGRNLSTGVNGNVTVNLIKPGTLYGYRVKQLDMRFGRTFTHGSTRRLKAMVDLYNVLNSNQTTVWNQTYGTTGASWQLPVQFLTGRFVKLGVQYSF